MSVEVLLNDIIKPGLCTSCGTCVGVCPTGCLDFDVAGEVPRERETCLECGLCLAVCPGKDIPFPELEEVVFGRVRKAEECYLGVYQALKIGQAVQKNVRRKAASGGLVTALLVHALESLKIDGAIVTLMDPHTPWLGRPQLVRNVEDIRQAAQSKYCLVPVNRILQQIVEKDLQRVAVVGLPCHIHGLQKMLLEPALKNLHRRISLKIGIFCATNYSRSVIEHFITEFFKIELDEVRSFQFRGGIGNREVIVTTRDGRQMKTTQANRIYLLTGHKKERCIVCADLFNELADISLGDVFTYEDHRAVPNLSSIIIRSQAGADLLASAEQGNRVKCLEAHPDLFYGNIGFERKIHGTAYRISERRHFGWPVPDYGRTLIFSPQPISPYAIPERVFDLEE